MLDPFRDITKSDPTVLASHWSYNLRSLNPTLPIMHPLRPSGRSQYLRLAWRVRHIFADKPRVYCYRRIQQSRPRLLCPSASSCLSVFSRARIASGHLERDLPLGSLHAWPAVQMPTQSEPARPSGARLTGERGIQARQWYIRPRGPRGLMYQLHEVLYLKVLVN